MKNDERFVQLGLGWVLRELYLADRDLVLSFLAAHYGELSREGLRYAIEKMPAELQMRLLAEHAAAKRHNAGFVVIHEGAPYHSRVVTVAS